MIIPQPVWFGTCVDLVLSIVCKVPSQLEGVTPFPARIEDTARRSHTIYHHDDAQWEGAGGHQVNRTKICTLRCGFQRDFGLGFDSGATTPRGLSHSYSYNVLYVHKDIAPISLQCRQHIIEAPRCRSMASRETPNSEQLSCSQSIHFHFARLTPAHYPPYATPRVPSPASYLRCPAPCGDVGIGECRPQVITHYRRCPLEAIEIEGPGCTITKSCLVFSDDQ